MNQSKNESGIAVIFDMDGVIFDTERHCISCWKKLAAEHGFEDVEPTFVKCIGTTEEVTRHIFLERYGEDFPFSQYDREVRRQTRELSDAGKLPLKTGVFEILSELQNREIPLALGSSNDTVSIRRELENAGLLSYFSQVIGGDMVKRGKPFPDIFLSAGEALLKTPKQCYVIEDSFNGIRAAGRAGMHPIMVPDMLEPDSEIRDIAEIVLPSLHEALSYLLAVIDA